MIKMEDEKLRNIVTQVEKARNVFCTTGDRSQLIALQDQIDSFADEVFGDKIAGEIVTISVNLGDGLVDLKKFIRGEEE